MPCCRKLQWTLFPSSLNLGGELSIELLGQGKCLSRIGRDLAWRREVAERTAADVRRNPQSLRRGVAELSRDALREFPRRGFSLRFSMEMREGGLMEWMVHEVRPRYNTADWTQGPKPAERHRPGARAEVRCAAISETETILAFPIAIITEAPRFPSTRFWTAGAGRSAEALSATSSGCEIASCRPSCASNRRPNFTRRNGISPIAPNPSALQFAPLQTELQGFSFTASPAGVLVTWASEVAHIRSLFEKPRGEDVLVHFHEHCGDLGHEFSTAPIEVLWSPGSAQPGGACQ